MVPRDWIFGRCSNPLAQRVSSPGTFHALVSISYERQEPPLPLPPRVESSANNNPFRPVGRFFLPAQPLPTVLYYNSHSGFLRVARLFVRPMAGQLKAFRRFATPFFLPPWAARARTHADPLLLRLRKSRDPWDSARAPSLAKRELALGFPEFSRFFPLPSLAGSNLDFPRASEEKSDKAKGHLEEYSVWTILCNA